jgi:hypothetical protein
MQRPPLWLLYGVSLVIVHQVRIDRNLLLRSAWLTPRGLLGPAHNRAGALDVDHSRASSFAVLIAEFLVQQKIMMGFPAECVEMMLASLQCKVRAMAKNIQGR